MLSTQKKNQVLSTLADLVARNEQFILEANKKDIAAYQGADTSMLDRLIVDSKKVAGMVDSIQQAIKLEDPEGKILYSFRPENGLRIENKTVPFGTILIIYESRPDVTIEAAITAFKAGNKILLKGGKEAKNTNLILADLWHKALKANGLSTNYATYLNLNRAETQTLIKENSHNVDLIIPRGGEGLLNFVRQNTDIPLIVSGRGNNFLFIDKDADFEMAIQIILNGKERISVCNALDKVLFHQEINNIEEKVAQLIQQLQEHNIEIIGDKSVATPHPEVTLAEEENVLSEEFLAPKIFLAKIKDIDTAIALINKHSGKHSATIVSSEDTAAEYFMQKIDSAAVYHNASTRFTDGGQFGFGAEMAISTQKLHFRGPVGIHQLVTNKWFVYGTGQIRK